MVADYERMVADYERMAADYERMVADYERMVADKVKEVQTGYPRKGVGAEGIEQSAKVIQKYVWSIMEA